MHLQSDAMRAPVDEQDPFTHSYRKPSAHQNPAGQTKQRTATESKKNPFGQKQSDGSELPGSDTNVSGHGIFAESP